MCKKLFYFILLLMFTSMSRAVTVDLNTGLVAWWTFDEGSGTVAQDYSGNNNNATLNGGATWVTPGAPGKGGSAVSLNGTSAYLRIEHSESLNVSRAATIEMWIYGGGTPAKQLIAKGNVSDGTAWWSWMALRLDNDPPYYRQLNFRNRIGENANSLNSNTAIPDAEWTHIAVTFDVDALGNNQKIYVNGAVNAESRSTAPLTQNTGPVYIGADSYAAAGRWWWQGMIDDSSVYNRALNAVEIKTIAGVKYTTDPTPKDGLIISSTDLTLEWYQGANVAATNGHHVYFSDQLADVNEGKANADKGFATETTYNVSSLVPGTTYYWRVDEVNDVHPDKLWRGDVWSFTVAVNKAYYPSPVDGATYVGRNRIVSWTQGIGAVSHKVYFGTDQTKVAAGDTSVNKGTRTDPNYTPGTLINDAIYYWRVDEFDGTNTHAGDIWSFVTTKSADPNLIGWWTFEDGFLDISGNENHGRSINDANIVTVTTRPYANPTNVLNLNGGDECIYVSYNPMLDIRNAVTVALWAYGGAGTDRFVSRGGWNNVSYTFRIEGTARTIQWRGTSAGNFLRSTKGFPTAEWTHVAITFSLSDANDAAGNPQNNQKIYFNGVLDAANRSTTLLTSTLYYLALGGRDGASNMWGGMLDDIRIYNRALSESEVKIAMTGDPNLAMDPVPANGSTPDIEHAKSLSWTKGANAAQHDVYFGTDAGAVQNATPSEPMGVYMARQNTSSYALLVALQPGQTYYWRVDEVNDLHLKSPWKGGVWSFTVADYLVVDDFEAYNNVNNLIYDAWADCVRNNTGMTVGHTEAGASFAERIIFNSGAQSMYMHYDNDGSINEGYGPPLEKTGTLLYSEAERQWTAAQDWTRSGVNSLTLWFRGIPASVGSFTAGPPIYTMTAGGADIYGTADQFHFAYKQLSGNTGSITAKVISITNTNNYAKAGVMIRETLAANSKHADVVFSPIGRVAFERRLTDGAASESTSQSGLAAPYWVRLRRSGMTFTGESSPDGINWTTVGTVSIPMGTDTYIGLCLTSHNTAATCTAEFSDVETSGTGSWKSQDIGIQSNIPEELYIVLQDSAGISSSAIKNSDPAATTIAEWTPWNIPLTSFTGVNLKAIKKMTIGVGDRANTQPGGSGNLYIDDIGLHLP